MLQTLLAATKKESIQFQHRSAAVYLYNETVAQFSNYPLLTQARYIHLAVLFKTVKNGKVKNDWEKSTSRAALSYQIAKKKTERTFNNTFSLELANSEFH